MKPTTAANTPIDAPLCSWEPLYDERDILEYACSLFYNFGMSSANKCLQNFIASLVGMPGEANEHPTHSFLPWFDDRIQSILERNFLKHWSMKKNATTMDHLKAYKSWLSHVTKGYDLLYDFVANGNQLPEKYKAYFFDWLINWSVRSDSDRPKPLNKTLSEVDAEAGYMKLENKPEDGEKKWKHIDRQLYLVKLLSGPVVKVNNWEFERIVDSLPVWPEFTETNSLATRTPDKEQAA